MRVEKPKMKLLAEIACTAKLWPWKVNEKALASLKKAGWVKEDGAGYLEITYEGSAILLAHLCS